MTWVLKRFQKYSEFKTFQIQSQNKINWTNLDLKQYFG